ncbi:MAG: type III secretion inner membrane ring lipoprotein SctJ [Aquisalimonadaceae bacterium]
MHANTRHRPGGRPRIGTLLLLALVLSLTGCKKEEVYGNLSEQEVNEMVAVLTDNGIKAEKTRADAGEYSLQVETGALADAVHTLREHGYPRERFANMGDVFQRQGLLSSPVEERARFIFAISQSVAETLSRIDGVITARVNLVMPENNPFERGTRPSSASVFIKYDPTFHLDELQPDIKLLVQKSIEGLAYDKITLVMLPAQQREASHAGRASAALNDSGEENADDTTWLALLMGLFATFVGYVLGKRRQRQRRKPDNKAVTSSPRDQYIHVEQVIETTPARREVP